MLSLLHSCGGSKPSTISELIDEGEFNNSQKYLQNRTNLITAENAVRFDSDPSILDTQENIANDFFIQLKNREISRMKEREKFPPSSYFLDIKRFIDQSSLLLTLKSVPKGAMLFGHMQTMGDYKMLIDDASVLPNCFIYTGPDNASWKNGSFRFAAQSPGPQWRSFQEMKNILGASFEKEMYESITLGKDDYPYEDIPEEYGKSLFRIDGLLSYKPLFRSYMLNVFKSLIRDNITYVELHSSFNGMYDLKRSYFNAFTELDLYMSIKSELQKDHPDFDFKIIYSVGQSQKRKSLLEHYETAIMLKKKYPEIIAGFDFAGINYTVDGFKGFLERYLQVQAENTVGSNIALYYNPKEDEKELNENIYDAILLGCTRVGYGYQLTKYPLLMDLIKQKDIAIEISPISNQVLGYSADLSDHPANIYLKHGMPVVLGSENQGIMKFSYSHQYYEAVLAWDLDLAGIKKLILNSIRYSHQPKWKKQQMEDLWRSRWRKFIQQLIERSKIEVIEY